MTLIINSLQLLLAGALGWLIGYERRTKHKPAGARTFSLICLGCTLMTLVGTKGFADATGAARVVATIITGIGFIGAGVIWKGGGSVKGITTAVLIWVCAGVGMAIGLGLYALAITAFLVSFAFVITKEADEIHELDAMQSDEKGRTRGRKKAKGARA